MLELLFLAWFVVLFNVNYALVLFSVLVPQKVSSSRKRPSFTVIIANADPGLIIEDTLKAVRKAKYPKKVEIIVVDSTGSQEVKRAARTHGAVIIKDTKAKDKSYALNLGIRKAKGEVLYFLDSDTVIDKHALMNIAHTLSSSTPVVVGSFRPANRSGLVSLMARAEVALMNTPNMWSSRFLRSSTINGRNFAIYKNILEEVDGFSAGLTEDINLSRRLYEAGYRVYFNPNVKSGELVPVAFLHMWKQHERWACGGLREIAKAIRTDFISFLAVFPFLITVSLFYVFLPFLNLLFLATGSIFVLASAFIGGSIVFYKSVKYLSPLELIISPVIITLLSVFIIAVILTTAAKMALGVDIEWYKTPK